MAFNWFDLLTIIGSVAFFIYGMKVMSEGIQRVTGSHLRNIMRQMTKNPYLGVLTGFLVTGLIQSSSATTVMTVSFVNAGLLSLVESTGIIMGANLGTTVTGWLIAAFGFSLSIYTICLPLFAIGVPMMIIKNRKYRYWGEIIVGFAIMFIALEMLKTTFPDAEKNAELFSFLQAYTGTGFFHLFLFMISGMLFAALIQSSSAAMILTFVMCAQGWLPFHSGVAMVLGENIGTTITAEIAALVGNVYAKRAARIHTLFNLIGAAWMIFLLPFFVKIIDRGMQIFSLGSPVADSESIPFGIAIFHTTFNFLNTLLLIWFVNGIVRLASKTLPSKGEEDEAFGLMEISGSSETPELSILQVQKEIVRFGDITGRMLGFTQDYLFNNDPDLEPKLYKRIKKYEKTVDKFSLELVEYLSKLSQQETSNRTNYKIRGYLSIIDDLEDCADIFFQMAKNIQHKKNNKIWFSPSQRNKLKELFRLLNEAFLVMKENINSGTANQVKVKQARGIEKEINRLKLEMRKKNTREIAKEDYNIKSSLVYYTLFSCCEKIGDNLLDVTEILTDEP